MTMKRVSLWAPELSGLSGLSAGELTARLREYVEGCGGLVTPSDVEIARELVRRARKAENLERLLGGPGGNNGPRAA
jgi:hypothetical protein